MTTTPETPRHKPGTVYSCDARRYGADRNLCPVHAAAPEMVALLTRLMNRDDDEALAADAQALLARIQRHLIQEDSR